MAAEKTVTLITDCDLTSPLVFDNPVPNPHKSKNAWLRSPNFTFDTTALDAKVKWTVPYGISDPFDSTKDPKTVPRRTLVFEVTDPETVAALRSVDERAKVATCESSERWWKKKVTPEVIEHCYQPMMVKNAQGVWTMRTKVNLWDHKKRLKVWKGTEGEEFTVEPASWEDIEPDMCVVAKIRINGLYITAEKFHMSATCSTIVFYETCNFPFMLPSNGRIVLRKDDAPKVKKQRTSAPVSSPSSDQEGAEEQRRGDPNDEDVETNAFE